jgi:hypothetical protein
MTLVLTRRSFYTHFYSFLFCNTYRGCAVLTVWFIYVLPYKNFSVLKFKILNKLASFKQIQYHHTHDTIDDESRPRFVLVREETGSQHVPHSWQGGDGSVHVSSAITHRLRSENA